MDNATLVSITVVSNKQLSQALADDATTLADALRPDSMEISQPAQTGPAALDPEVYQFLLDVATHLAPGLVAIAGEKICSWLWNQSKKLLKKPEELVITVGNVRFELPVNPTLEQEALIAGQVGEAIRLSVEARRARDK